MFIDSGGEFLNGYTGQLVLLINSLRPLKPVSLDVLRRVGKTDVQVLSNGS